jgi:hypothetical protein
MDPGAIIFGGIDTKKYKGTLEKCPIIPAASAPLGHNRFVATLYALRAIADVNSYWIEMLSVGITKPAESPKKYPASSTPVFLDSGGTLSQLPTSIFNAILADFPGATPSPDGSGLYVVDCALASQSGTIDFAFGKTVINVPYREFIWSRGSECVLGMLPNDDEPVLGGKWLN